jgi:uncharacterized protein YjbJ (UPF0337 family)
MRPLYRATEVLSQGEIMSLNWNVVEGNWKQYVGTVKYQWEELTDEQLAEIEGKREKLAGKIQEAYGIGTEEAEEEIKEFEGLYKI